MDIAKSVTNGEGGSCVRPDRELGLGAECSKLTSTKAFNGLIVVSLCEGAVEGGQASEPARSVTTTETEAIGFVHLTDVLFGAKHKSCRHIIIRRRGVFF